MPGVIDTCPNSACGVFQAAVIPTGLIRRLWEIPGNADAERLADDRTAGEAVV